MNFLHTHFSQYPLKYNLDYKDIVENLCINVI